MGISFNISELSQTGGSEVFFESGWDFLLILCIVEIHIANVHIIDKCFSIRVCYNSKNLANVIGNYQFLCLKFFNDNVSVLNQIWYIILARVQFLKKSFLKGAASRYLPGNFLPQPPSNSISDGILQQNNTVKNSMFETVWNRTLLVLFSTLYFVHLQPQIVHFCQSNYEIYQLTFVLSTSGLGDFTWNAMFFWIGEDDKLSN